MEARLLKILEVVLKLHRLLPIKAPLPLKEVQTTSNLTIVHPKRQTISQKMIAIGKRERKTTKRREDLVT